MIRFGQLLLLVSNVLVSSNKVTTLFNIFSFYISVAKTNETVTKAGEEEKKQIEQPQLSKK